MDVIVCVGGDQVGRVGGRVFELSDELNHHADSRGRIEMLVQDSRSFQLRNVRLQLSDAQAGLAGTIVLPGARIPADAVVTLLLENTSRPHYVVRNGQYSFRVPPNTTQIPFTLNYDPRYVFPTDTYRLRAYVTSGGRTIYDTLQPQYVITKGNPSTVQLRLSPASYVAVSSPVSPTNTVAVTTASYTNYDAVSQRVTAAYKRYLGRIPSAMELAAWHQAPDINYSLSKLPLQLMGSQEYFDMVGNNNVVWIKKVFGEIIGHPPSSLELDQWMRRFAELRYSRMGVLNQMQSIKPS